MVYTYFNILYISRITNCCHLIGQEVLSQTFEICNLFENRLQKIYWHLREKIFSM